MARSFTEHYVGVSRHIPMAGSFTGQYVGDFRHTLRAGVSPVTTWGRF